MKFKVVEKFISINGEGKLSGQLAIFIRFAGCNLDCSYCDTRWANEKDVEYEWMTADQIYEYIKVNGVRNVTLTGGEPLLQKGIMELLTVLSLDPELVIEIETNGSIELGPFTKIEKNRPRFTMDYKLGSSQMESKMLTSNFKYLGALDTVKFVVGNIDDLKRAKHIIDQYQLVDKTSVYISPVFGEIEMVQIVEFMKENKMNGVTLQVQLHKIIWDPEKKGV
ncbi:putative 7-carboxy-7-deazaguanine synthase QueE [Vulcanibacillus modesticaldus]|uniref:7-carboxy-7-deazaguanine synthase n=1 Tax=Vulcanibacillus modesticaldus TaxID=337097 RepID=A0A1D2YW87_9BACI|nr:putative 7-carboxy-7-deazaguanine synthase QueE [Vulcanibacillus modesticaldus]OEF99917.1 putative 7-carboxy-7-deazaguanine synthase QueE [Vulcanibacillus modesticaldus]